MANHLNLKHTLLEFDLQGNVTIFSNGRSARLLASEIPQLLHWLTASKDEQLSQFGTTRNTFTLTNGTVIINEIIRIVPPEVQQMINWLRSWLIQHV